MLSLTIGRHAMLAEKEEFKATDRDLERQQATSYETSLVSFFVDVCAQGKMAAINYCLFPVDLRRRGFDEIWHNIYPPLASPHQQQHLPTSGIFPPAPSPPLASRQQTQQQPTKDGIIYAQLNSLLSTRNSPTFNCISWTVGLSLVKSHMDQMNYFTRALPIALFFLN